MGRSARAVRIDALSKADLNYLFGLFLADGYQHTKITKRGWIKSYKTFFFFQGNEIAIARKLVRVLRKLGLNPSSNRHRHCDN
jgi:hypothetical protein